MATTSCSHWWHAPIYTAMSIALIIIFIFINVPSNPHLQPHHSTQPTTPSNSDFDHYNNFIKHSLINATQILNSNGFNFIATLLHLSPHLFLSSTPSTIFAIHDSSISNLALPPSILQELLLYHTLPYKYSMKQLLKKPVNTCFQTRVPLKNVGITRKSGEDQNLIEINHVLVSHPDLVLDGPFSIQGVLKPFASLNNVDQESSNWDIGQLAICDSINYGDVTHKKKNEWRRVVQILSLNAFIPFAIGLHSVIDDIIQEYGNLSSVTVFAPPNMAVLSLPSPLLDKFVKYHIVNQSHSFQELASLPRNASMRTLVHKKDVVITSSEGVSKVMTINGVEVTAPDIYSSKKFSIHGVARSLIGMKELLGT